MIKSNMIGTCNHILQLDFTGYSGRVFFTTDVHGSFDLLHEKMKEFAFDSSKDILISSGDWCDRGVDSKYVLDYLKEPWVYSTRANHEELFIGAHEENWEGRFTNCLLANGGRWVVDVTDAEVKVIYETFKSMPLAIELVFEDYRVGVIHAQVPYSDWDKFSRITKGELEWDGGNTSQWARDKYDNQSNVHVRGIDIVLTGHTPTNSGEIEQLGNQVYCDLGSFFRQKLSFFEINKQFIEDVMCQKFKK